MIVLELKRPGRPRQVARVLTLEESAKVDAERLKENEARDRPVMLARGQHAARHLSPAREETE